VLQCCSDDQLQQHWQEAAALAGLRFDWKDTTDPLACAQAAAYALHYYPHAQVRNRALPLLSLFMVDGIAAVNVEWYRASLDTKEADGSISTDSAVVY